MPSTAAELAERLETANNARRTLTKETLAEVETAVRAAAAAATETEPAIVVRGPWPVGIVGLVAARLAEDGARPVVIGAEVGDVVRASCRASGFDLAAALETCRDLFVRHGGHAGAAGFEIEASRWDAFRERFLAAAAGSHRPVVDPRPELRLDLALAARDVDYPLLRELSWLAPTGLGNPEPLIAILGLTVTRVRSASGGHTQLTLRRERDVLDAIAFGRADLTESVAEGDRVDIVATLASRTYGGFESLQLLVRDVAPSGSHPEAAAILALGVPVMASGPIGPRGTVPAVVGGIDR